MALQAFPLNRAQDAAGASLIEVTPKNWHRFPSPVTGTMLATANSTNEGKPRYTGAGATADWVGGVKGDDVDTATANVSIANDGGGANAADYAPRTQAAKATATGNTLVPDVARPRGWIAPQQPYQGNATPPVAPTLTALTPNTIAAGTNPLIVTLTGTGFTAWSKVFTGAQTIPERFSYVSPTQLMIMIDPRSSVAGTATVVVQDHGMNSAPATFTFT